MQDRNTDKSRADETDKFTRLQIALVAKTIDRVFEEISAYNQANPEPSKMAKVGNYSKIARTAYADICTEMKIKQDDLHKYEPDFVDVVNGCIKYLREGAKDKSGRMQLVDEKIAIILEPMLLMTKSRDAILTSPHLVANQIIAFREMIDDDLLNYLPNDNVWNIR